MPKRPPAPKPAPQAQRKQSKRDRAGGWQWRSEGVKARDYIIDEEDAARRALREAEETFDRERRRQSQVIEFRRVVVGIAFAADIHAGSSGTDYERLFREAELIRDTPGLYAATVGDLVDNFVVLKLAHTRRDNRLSIDDEWAIVRKYLKMIGPKHVLSVGGNHEFWTKMIAGLDYFKDIVAAISPDVLYDTDDSRSTIKIGSAEWPGRVRHKWSGASIYNPTHGIERGFLFDHDFVWGIGAHTHASGVVREFNAAGVTGLAGLCGSYKRIDAYARQHGFRKPNNSTAIVILFDPDTGAMAGFDNLHLAATVLMKINA